MNRNVTLLAAGVAFLALACRSKLPEETAPPATAGQAASPGRTAAPAAQEPRAPDRPARPEAAPAEPESGRLAGITAAHNRIREPLGIAPLTWSPELARYAQAWADKLKRQGCGLQHRPRSGPDAQRHGENLYGVSGHQPAAGEVVDTWAAEVADYDAKKNRCRGTCGHYTQVVWRKSQRLGCAMAACGDSEVWVCNYDPPGNFLGQRPY